jgi:hypothetical protein
MKILLYAWRRFNYKLRFETRTALAGAWIS